MCLKSSAFFGGLITSLSNAVHSIDAMKEKGLFSTALEYTAILK